jgi:uncharacterized protein YigE (DUF2233 family)
MKKLCLLLVCVAILAWFLFKSSPAPVNPSPTPNNSLEYLVENQPFRVASFIVKNPAAISLIPNFTQKNSSLSVAKNSQCTMLTSGGFYSKANNPIGLFISDGKQIGTYQTNALFNGFFSVQTNENAIIGDQIPESTSPLALQSGPLLITDGVVRKLSIRDDEPARRIVMAQTNDNAIVFLALYSGENTFQGPKLADVPQHLKKIENLLGISITNALNLDGGSASVFIAKDYSLSELTPVGSFFCVQ